VVEGGRGGEHLLELQALAVLRGDGVGALVAVLHAGLGGQLAGGLGEGEALYVHHELENVAAGAAAEAEEDLLVGVDREGGGLLVVKGAVGLVVAPSPPESRDVLAHDLDDVEFLANQLYDG
jgi:hypothetical protein